MDGAADLLALLPEVQGALCGEFDGIECSIGPGPDLSQSPFRLDIPHLGRQKSALFTDGQSSCCLELVLGRGRNWRDPLSKLFDRLYPNKWAFFIAELEQGQAIYHLLCSNSPPISTRREDTPDSTEPSSQISSPPESVWFVQAQVVCPTENCDIRQEPLADVPSATAAARPTFD
nr:Protein ZC247.2 [Haemonchus contortus]